jgi:hypothetical protein
VIALGLATAPLAAEAKVPNPSLGIVDDGGNYSMTFTGAVTATSESYEVVVKGKKNLELVFVAGYGRTLDGMPPIGEKVTVLFSDDGEGHHIIVRIEGTSGTWTPTGGADDVNPCFLTTAITRVVRSADDGPELTALRAYRDRYLLADPERAADVSRYYEIAPGIVRRVEALPNAADVWRVLFEDHLGPILALLDAGDDEAVHAAYRDMVADLERALA